MEGHAISHDGDELRANLRLVRREIRGGAIEFSARDVPSRFRDERFERVPRGARRGECDAKRPMREREVPGGDGPKPARTHRARAEHQLTRARVVHLDQLGDAKRHVRRQRGKTARQSKVMANRDEKRRGRAHRRHALPLPGRARRRLAIPVPVRVPVRVRGEPEPTLRLLVPPRRLPLFPILFSILFILLFPILFPIVLFVVFGSASTAAREDVVEDGLSFPRRARGGPRLRVQRRAQRRRRRRVPRGEVRASSGRHRRARRETPSTAQRFGTRDERLGGDVRREKVPRRRSRVRVRAER